MTNGAAGAGGATVVIANAIKASGAIVRVEPQEFLNILSKAKEPLARLDCPAC